MIPTIVGTSKQGISGAGTLNVPIPAGSASAIAIVSSAQGASITVPSGWTQIGTNGRIFGIYLCPDGQSGPAWNVAQATAYQTAVLVVGYAQEVAVAQQTLAATATAPSVTTTEPSLVLRLVNDLNDSGAAITYPTNATLGRDQIVFFNSSAGWSASIGVAHESRPNAGATGTAAWTVPAAYQPGAATLALVAPDETTPPPASPWSYWNGTAEVPVTFAGVAGAGGTLVPGTMTPHA